VEKQLRSVQDQLDRLEERRLNDLKHLEEQSAKVTAAVESAVKSLTGGLDQGCQIFFTKTR
jgi:hypothetical protein